MAQGAGTAGSGGQQEARGGWRGRAGAGAGGPLPGALQSAHTSARGAFRDILSGEAGPIITFQNKGTCQNEVCFPDDAALPCCILSSVMCDESFLKGALFLLSFQPVYPIVQLCAIVLGYY